MARVRKFGDWTMAGVVLQKAAASIREESESVLMDCGKLVLKTMRGHIDAQDLPWPPLSERWRRIKGHGIIYVDTGTLYKELGIRRIASKPKGSTIFIGASPWKRHKPSGMKFSELMKELEYGSPEKRIPSRPLVRPSWEECRDTIAKKWPGISVVFRR